MYIYIHTMQRSLCMERNGLPLRSIERLRCIVCVYIYIYIYIYVSSYRPDDGHVIDRNM